MILDKIGVKPIQGIERILVTLGLYYNFVQVAVNTVINR